MREHSQHEETEILISSNDVTSNSSNSCVVSSSSGSIVDDEETTQLFELFEVTSFEEINISVSSCCECSLMHLRS
jgi:hypothetical protein